MSEYERWNQAGAFSGRPIETNQQREAVARLCTYCERMIGRGHLPVLDELNLRNFVNETCTAFNMAPVYDRMLEVVRIEMEKAS